MSTRIASLGMYVTGAQEAANDTIWAAMARSLKARRVADVPDRLERRRSVQDTWRDPGLLFGQICGYPLIRDPALSLRVIGVPVYDAPECGAGLHRSLIVTRTGDAASLADYRGRRAVINDRGSNTGMNLFRSLVAEHAGGERFFACVKEAGGHRLSLSALILDDADIAAIDAVTYAAVLRAEPELAAAFQVIASTAVSATPPFVTASGTDAEAVVALQSALDEISVDPALAGARRALFLDHVLPGDRDRYLPLLAIENDAATAGYPILQ